MTGKTDNIIGPDSFSPRQLPLRQLSRPQGTAVHLWHLDFNQVSNPLSLEAAVSFESLSAFQQTANRRFFLRLLLGAYLGIPGKDVIIKRRMKGRPELDPGQSRGLLNFSVARSGACYLIGISSGADIGVDLEVATRQAGKPLALAKRYFSADETNELTGMGEYELQRAFMHTWSCKEAIVKASGLGIANQLCRFTVDVNPDNTPSVLHMLDDDAEAWKLAMARPVNGAIAAIAVRQQAVSLECFNLT